MPFFSYKVRDEKNNVVSGLIEAPNPHTAGRVLRDRGWFIISIVMARQNVFERIFAGFRHVGFSEIVTFTRQLATMINAGLPLTESLHILESQMTNSTMHTIVVDILRSIESGSSFFSALEKYPVQFSPIYRSLIQAGEAAGMLDNVLDRLADNLEREKEFRGKVKGALIYPAIIVTGMIALMLIMVIFVVPRLSDLYKEFGSDLPFATKVLVALSSGILNYWWVAILGIFFSIMVFNRFKRSKRGVVILDRIVLSLPVFGPLQKKIILVEFTRTTGILVGAGVPILTALEIIGNSVASYQYQQAIKDAAQKVEKGAALGDAMAANPIFPAIVPQMVRVGESTGKLDEILGKLSRYFEIEAEQATKTLTTSLEPLIMVVLGIGVGLLVWSVITPIYSLTTKFQ